VATHTVCDHQEAAVVRCRHDDGRVHITGGYGDGPSAGCSIVVAAFKTPTVVTGLYDVAAVGKPIEQRSGHLGAG
jgi:hypothetical protein